MTAWLPDTLLATSGLTLLVLIVREPVRRLFGSRVTYGLWLIPVARLFMPTLTHTVERTVPAGPALQPVPLPGASESLWMARLVPADQPQSLLDRLGGPTIILVTLWLTGAALLFASRLVAYYRDRRAILASSVELGRLGSVRVIGSPEIVSPVALGIFERLIVVPLQFEGLYGLRERQLVLEHELAHHRSGDLVVNLFAFILLCLQWFNPLAWLAHAAFRFDQEAACDARVLDKVTVADRGDYGRAIAKAASGRALLFASALDHRNTLQRRLQSMLRSSSPAHRFTGRLLVLTGIATALPLTASHAVEYVDVRAPAETASPVADAAPIVAARTEKSAQAAPANDPTTASAAAARPAREGKSYVWHERPSQRSALASAQMATAALPPAAAPSTYKLASNDGRTFTILGSAAAPAAAYKIMSPDGRDFIVQGAPPQQFEIRGNGETFVIDGKTKRWEDLNSAEKAEVRSAVAKATAALARTHIDQARIMQQIAAIPDRAHLAQLQTELARTQAGVAESVRRMDQRAARDRAAGRDRGRLEVALRATLQSVRAVDLQAAARALATVDQAKIAESVARAEQSMQQARDELARIQARIDADHNP